jgi:hypothetical protein
VSDDTHNALSVTITLTGQYTYRPSLVAIALHCRSDPTGVQEIVSVFGWSDPRPY